jgi:hypothetical protein
LRYPELEAAIGGRFFVVVLGLGMATSVAPLTTTVMNSVSEQHVGTASGINNAVARVAGLLSIAVFGVIMLASFNRNLSSGLAALDLEPSIRQELDNQRGRLAAIEIPPGGDGRSTTRIRETVDASFVAGFRVVMWTASGLALLSAVTALLYIENKPKG